MSAPMDAEASPSVDALNGTDAAQYGFSFTPHPGRVRAVVGGVTIADSMHAMLLEETRLDPVFYFPRRDVRMDLMQPTALRTHCPFKGNASYWSLDVGGRQVTNLMWSYEDPLPDAALIAGYVAFYPDLIDELFVDEHAMSVTRVGPQSHYANPLLAWLIRDATHLATPVALTESFANQMLAAGIPLWRLNIVIRTLHPQLMAVAYRWWRKSGEVEEIFLPYETLTTPGFQNSPLVPIFEGAGGIRRRLDVDHALLDFPILRDLRAEGATDYVAMPMTFSDGQINTVTLASARPGGFTTQDLGHVYGILETLGRLYEVHALRYRATTLLDTYLGRQAGVRVLDGLIKRGDGEDIHAVIWFCDLRDSTPLAQSMSRTEFLGVLNSFFDCMAGAVMENGGQVLRFIGDAALAIFPIDAQRPVAAGTREAHDHALAAALDARERMRTLNTQREEQALMPLRYGIALHPGEVTYGNIGTASRLEFTVIGDAANRAARIESMCKTLDRNILVSEDFARMFPGRFDEVGRHALRGVDEEMPLFALRR